MALRRPGDEYSTVKAAAIGMIPPSPIPPTNRNTANMNGDGDRASPAMHTENTTSDATNIRRRPYKSPSVPNTIPPTNIPAIAQLPNAPSWIGVRCHEASLASAGNIAPITPTS